MDIFDQAQEDDANYRNQSLSALRNKIERSRLAESRTHCLECGEPIPIARREAIPGCTLCLDCQHEFENLGR